MKQCTFPYCEGIKFKIPIPGLEQGKGFAPKSVKLPIVKTMGWGLTVAAVVVHAKELYGAFKSRDTLNEFREGALFLTNSLSFIPVLGYVGLAAEAVDTATIQFGNWYYSPIRRRDE